MMQMRTKGNDPAVSIRLNKEEWNDHVNKGNKHCYKKSMAIVTKIKACQKNNFLKKMLARL